jgi:hypothetical protein
MSKSKTNAVPWQVWLMTGLIAGAAAMAGCGPTKEEAAIEKPAEQGLPAVDRLARISASFVVDSGTVHLSKQEGTTLAWFNGSQSTLFIVFDGAPIGEPIPPGEYSAEHRVCIRCAEGSYPYKIYRKSETGELVDTAGDPPAEPKIDVGS